MRRREELDRKLLTYLFRHGPAPRPELVAYTGVRAATVLESVDRLKAAGLVIEPGRHSKKTGRRAPHLECAPDHAHWVGIDFNTRKTLAIRIDNCGKILDRVEICGQQRASAEDGFAEIFKALDILQANAKEQWSKVSGIGFSDPGTVDMDRGLSLGAVNVPGWEKLNTVKTIEEKTKLPCAIWSGEMVRANEEYLARFTDQPQKLFHLFLDDTIGAGFICNGDIYAGSSGHGMEIGHIVIVPNGPPCRCGNNGCLEAVAGIPAMRRRIREFIESGVDTTLSAETFSISDLIASVRQDKTARIIADEISEALGTALASVVTLLNPDIIVLGGEITALGDILLQPIRRMLELNCFAEATKKLKLEISDLNDDDTAKGAAILMRDRILLS